MTRALTLLLLASIAFPVVAASMSDAFIDGTNFGRSNNSATQANIRSGAAQATVPHASPSAPAASYFGAAGLGAPASATIDACAAASLNPNAYDDQACRAMNFTQTNPAIRPSFTIHPTDPLMAKSRAILNDPAAIAGNIAGTYSGCTTQTIKSPDIYETQVCNEYRTLEHYTCNKILTVNVVDNGLDCSYGAYLTPNPRILFIRPYVFVGAVCAEDIKFMWIYGYSECNGTDAPQFRATILPSDVWQVLSVSLPCGGNYNLWGSCPSGKCSYAVGSVYDSFVCDQYDYSSPSCDDSSCTYPCLSGHNETVYSAVAGFNWQRPVHTFTITDTWNDQCATYEARLP